MMVIMSDLDNRMKKALEVVEKELLTIRTGRANPAILDRISIEYYGSKTPLKSVANLSVPEGRTLVVSPFDHSTLAAIEKAIIDSDVGLTPTNDVIKTHHSPPSLVTTSFNGRAFTLGLNLCIAPFSPLMMIFLS